MAIRHKNLGPVGGKARKRQRKIQTTTTCKKKTSLFRSFIGIIFQWPNVPKYSMFQDYIHDLHKRPCLLIGPRHSPPLQLSNKLHLIRKCMNFFQNSWFISPGNILSLFIESSITHKNLKISNPQLKTVARLSPICPDDTIHKNSTPCHLAFQIWQQWTLADLCLLQEIRAPFLEKRGKVQSLGNNVFFYSWIGRTALTSPQRQEGMGQVGVWV